MSTQENKIEVITEFLRNRASLGRVTNMQEVARVAGEQLAAKGYRRSGTTRPVRREKVAEALTTIAETTQVEGDFALLALVTHFWDNKVPSRFVGYAQAAELDAEQAFVDLQQQAFSKYQAQTPVDLDAKV